MPWHAQGKTIKLASQSSADASPLNIYKFPFGRRANYEKWFSSTALPERSFVFFFLPFCLMIPVAFSFVRFGEPFSGRQNPWSIIRDNNGATAKALNLQWYFHLLHCNPHLLLFLYNAIAEKLF